MGGHERKRAGKRQKELRELLRSMGLVAEK